MSSPDQRFHDLLGDRRGGRAAGPALALEDDGVRVAGKTGTAESGVRGTNTTSFMTFAPADNPRVAVAVILERQSGTGGTTAAPIAKQIMEALIR